LGFGGRAQVGGHAVVFDDTGTFEAISVSLQPHERSVTSASTAEQVL